MARNWWLGWTRWSRRAVPASECPSGYQSRPGRPLPTAKRPPGSPLLPTALPPHSVRMGRPSVDCRPPGGHQGCPYCRLPLFLLTLLLLTNCRPDPPGGLIPLSPHHSLAFLDSLAAAAAISRDEAQGFFERIQPLDMAIQMGQPLPIGADRTQVLAAYRDFLRADVASFTPQEQKILLRAFRQAFERCEQVSPGFFPDTVFLIKTPGQHYGPSVYYTREKSIIIPQNELARMEAEGLALVMLHELFHLYSRYHPQKREQLYALIGFQHLPQKVRLPDCLLPLLMLNPDGIDSDYALPLELPGGEAALAIPLLLSNAPAYIPSQLYFDYLDFQLFPLQPTDSSFIALTADGCRSPLPPPDSLPAFWAKIGDNTTYIIHPDEILADNFVLLALSKAGRRQPLSPRGRSILEGLQKVLRQGGEAFREPQKY